jgi:hypothetical protein
MALPLKLKIFYMRVALCSILKIRALELRKSESLLSQPLRQEALLGAQAEATAVHLCSWLVRRKPLSY